jgi:hypothetical protein
LIDGLVVELLRRKDFDMIDATELPDGFYNLRCPRVPESETCLVRLYTPHDPPVRGIGFGVWDGGAFMPLADITDDSRLTPLTITETPNA